MNARKKTAAILHLSTRLHDLIRLHDSSLSTSHSTSNLRLDLRGVFSPPLMISDQTTSDLAVTGNDRSIEYYFASDAR